MLFVDFRKSLDNVPRDKLSQRLEEIMVPPEIRIFVIYLYETVISKLKTDDRWYKDIKCNIEVNKGCPLSPTIFGIYIDKLVEECLEITGCKGTELARIIITLLLYVDDIILHTRNHDDLDE